MKTKVTFALFAFVSLLIQPAHISGRPFLAARRSEAKMIDLAQEAAASQLQPGKVIERTISGGERHAYRLAITEGQTIQLVVKEVDVEADVALLRPDGQEIVLVSEAYGSIEPKLLRYVADVGGAYRVEVRCPGSQSSKGSYRLR